MDTSVQEGVCPVCGEPMSLGDAMESDCARCGGHILVNKVTGELVNVPGPPDTNPQRVTGVTGQVVKGVLIARYTPTVVLLIILALVSAIWALTGFSPHASATHRQLAIFATVMLALLVAFRVLYVWVKRDKKNEPGEG